MKDWKTVNRSSTAMDVINAIKQNAENSEQLDSMARHKLTSGVIWTGQEEIEGQNCEFGHNVVISPDSIRQVRLDNWQLYFSSVNKIVVLDRFTIDIRQYLSEAPQYLYINDDGSYEVNYYKITDYNSTKVLIGRIYQAEEGNVLHFYCMPYLIDATHFEVSECWPELITGMSVKPAGTTAALKMKLHHTIGKIKLPSVNFNARMDTDTLVVNNSDLQFVAIRRTTRLNRVDYSRLYEEFDPNHYVNNAQIVNVPTGKWTLNRIYYDLYEKVFVQQYAPEVFNSSGEAMAALNDYVYPPPNDKMDYMILCIVCVKQGCTDLNNQEECIFVKYLDRDVSTSEDDAIATDNIARQQIVLLRNDFNTFKTWTQAQVTRIDGVLNNHDQRITQNTADIASLNQRLADTNTTLNNHINNRNNPHQVTKSQVGLGNVSNLDPAGIFNNQKDTTVLTKYVKKSEQITDVSQLNNDLKFIKSSDGSIINEKVKEASSFQWSDIGNNEMMFCY